MDQKLTFNDGTEITGHMHEANGRLFLYLEEISLQEAFTLLIEPENTREIRAERFGQEITVRGYNDLLSISKENGMICASMGKD